MSDPFSFELPEPSQQLTDSEYVNLVNRIRGNFLSYVSVLDSSLTLIISDLFLRDKTDFALWAKTVFDEDRNASFGAKIIWLGRILKNHKDFSDSIDESTRIRIQNKLNEIREIRNDFAHNFAHNKEIVPKNVHERIIELHDFEEGVSTTKFFKMQEIMDIINDSWILENLTNLLKLAREVRER